MIVPVIEFFPSSADVPNVSQQKCIRNAKCGSRLVIKHSKGIECRTYIKTAYKTDRHFIIGLSRHTQHDFQASLPMEKVI